MLKFEIFLKYRFSIIWAIIILILSGLSGDTVNKISFINIPHFDKIVHAILFQNIRGRLKSAEIKKSPENDVNTSAKCNAS